MKKRDLKVYVFLILFGLVLLGGMGAVAYYGDDTGAILQMGWRRGAIVRAATEFIAQTQRKEYEAALALCDPNRLGPVRKKDQLVGIKKVDPSGMNSEQWEFARMFPAGTPQVSSVESSTVEGGAFLVNLTFPDGVQTRFLIGNVHGAFKVVAYLGSTL